MIGGFGANLGRPPLPASPPRTAWGRGESGCAWARGENPGVLRRVRLEGTRTKAALPPDDRREGWMLSSRYAYSTTAGAAPMRASSFSTSSTTRRGSIGLAR